MLLKLPAPQLQPSCSCYQSRPSGCRFTAARFGHRGGHVRQEPGRSGGRPPRGLPVQVAGFPSHAQPSPIPAIFELAEGLEEPVQLLYIVTLLGFAAVGAYLVVRQVLIRRDLEEAAKVLGERIRSGDGNSEDCFELGVILLRKKLFTQATKNLDRARKAWTGPQDQLAQVYNALGFAYLNMEKYPLAVQHYQKAVELQPGYVTAWNNLGDAFERSSKKEDALRAYEEALSYSPDNKIARQRFDALRTQTTASS